MKNTGRLYRIYDLYVDGFRHMKVGKTLWVIILIKLFIIFVVLRLFFFPDYLSVHSAGGQKSDYVAGQLLGHP